MAMSPRLLRPRASSALVAVDSAAKAYINAVRTADGGQYMEAGVQRAIDAFVIGCKADGIWSAIKASCILMGARTLSGALVPLVGSAPTNNNFVSGDYNRKTGLVGNGTNKYLDSNRLGNADPQNNVHLAVYASTVDTSSRAYLGVGGGEVGATTLGNSGSTTLFARCRSSDGDTEANYNAAGILGMSRSASGSFVLRGGGASTSKTRNSDGVLAQNFLVFAVRTGGGANAAFSFSRLAFYSIGESLTLATLDTRVTALYNAIGAAIP